MVLARSLTLALFVTGGIAAWPAPSRGQDAPRTTNPDAGERQESVESLFRGLRVLSAAVTLEDSRRERAIRRVRERVMADKDLQGGYYQFRSSKRLLRESDLQRGKTELRRMLRDRPEMKRHLSEDDELFQWAAKKFAGEDLPTWIEWQDRWETESEACHMPPDDKSPGWIFVKNIRSSRLQQLANGSQAFDTLWLHAAYELHNIQGHEEFNRLYEKVYAGTITRDEFVLGMARTEYGAWLRLRLFYIEKYYPWARNWGIDTDLVAWGLDTPSTFDEWVSQYPRGYSYPWQYYGEFHDDVTVAKELQGTAVGWGKLKKQAGAAWEQVKTDALLRHRARQLWNQVLRRDSTKSNVTLPINAGVSELP